MANLAKPDSQKNSRSVLLVAVGEHKDVEGNSFSIKWILPSCSKLKLNL